MGVMIVIYYYIFSDSRREFFLSVTSIKEERHNNDEEKTESRVIRNRILSWFPFVVRKTRVTVDTMNKTELYTHSNES